MDESQALVRALQDDLRACKHRSEDAEIECETLRRKNREAEEELRGIRDTSQQREHSTQLTVHQLSSQLKQMQEMIDCKEKVSFFSTHNLLFSSLSLIID